MLLNEKKNHYLRTGLILTGLMAALALVGCVWTPYSPTAMSGSEKFLAPCLRHLFGTDNFGRDIFSRVRAGAGTTFFISAATVCIGAVVGTLVGAFTGYFGGWLDEARRYYQTAVTMAPDNPEYQRALDILEGRGAAYRPDGYGSVTTGTCGNSDCLRLCGATLCCNALGVPVCFC